MADQSQLANIFLKFLPRNFAEILRVANMKKILYLLIRPFKNLFSKVTEQNYYRPKQCLGRCK